MLESNPQVTKQLIDLHFRGIQPAFRGTNVIVGGHTKIFTKKYRFSSLQSIMQVIDRTNQVDTMKSLSHSHKNILKIRFFS